MAVLPWLIPLGLLALATWHDLRTREIPDWISLAIAVWAIGLAAFSGTMEAWLGLVVGGVLGFATTAPLFYLGGIGGADVKLVAAIGALLGPVWLLVALFWIAMAGGVSALVAKIRGKADFAYLPAILAGFVACLVQKVV